MKRIESCLKEQTFFREEQVEMNQFPSQTEGGIINVYDDVRYQEILGFGGSFTESSAYLYSCLNREEKRRFLDCISMNKKESGIILAELISIPVIFLWGFMHR
jgi:hypothetical protein